MPIYCPINVQKTASKRRMKQRATKEPTAEDFVRLSDIGNTTVFQSVASVSSPYMKGTGGMMQVSNRAAAELTNDIIVKKKEPHMRNKSIDDSMAHLASLNNAAQRKQRAIRVRENRKQRTKVRPARYQGII